MKNKKTIVFSVILILSVCLFILSFVKSFENPGFKLERITEFSQLTGKEVGVTTGSNFEALLKSHIPGAIPVYFNAYPDQIETLKTNKIVGFMADEPVARSIISLNPNFRMLDQKILDDSYGFVFAKNNPGLKNEVNKTIIDFQEDGTMKKLDSIWFGKSESKRIIKNISPIGPRGVIKLATNSSCEPFVYYKNNKIVGFEIDLLNRIAQKLGYGLEIIDMDFSAIIPAVVSGKADIAASCISITAERAKSVLFSVPDYRGGTVIMVNDKVSFGNDMSFGDSFRKSFYRTFISEGRYKLVLNGLNITLIVSFFAIILGSVLAGVICRLRMSKNRWLSIIGKSYIGFFQGTPILVFLMIVYYVVFKQVDIDPVLVAILAFSLNYAAYAAEIYRTGINAVGKGEIEAATAMGFSKIQTFVKIVMPQALKHAMPPLRSEVMSTIRMTSVVGYIGIQDLTKVSDIIRSRTYETFFPLVATALIYFTITILLAHFLSHIEFKIDPKSRKRVLKGVFVQK